jgi:predicted lipase
VGKLNLKAIYEINNPQTGTEGFITIDNSANIVIVVFTGSQSLIDWLQNVQVTRKSLNNGVFIHSGAYESVNSVYSGIKRVLNSKIRCGKKIYITGHSRGGMLASVLTYLLARDYPHHLSQIKVYTFGSPAVGNKKFANFFKNIESYDVTVIGDIVSYKGCPVYKLLHSIFGYVKSPNVVYLPYQGNHSIKTYINQLKAIQSWGGYTRSYRSNMNHSG